MKDLPPIILIMLFGWLVFNYILPIKVVSNSPSPEITTYCTKK